MHQKTLPFTKSLLEGIIARHPTPFHVYDEEAIRQNARRLVKAFAWNKGFKEYFAVKALPNPTIMRLLHEEGLGMDCSSLAELVLCERAGIRGEDIIFSSNNTPAEEFQKARELGAIINLDDISHIEYLETNAGLPDLLCFRHNPGSSREGNDIIGKPEEAKFGLTRQQLFDAYRLAKEKGVTRFGLHTMMASNELDPGYFVETVKMLLELCRGLNETLGIKLEFINMGGGIGIPYRPEQRAVDIEALSARIQNLYQEFPGAPRLSMECGRMITGPYGYLISTVRHKKDTYKQYVGLDASMGDLMRPGMYGAYHHVTVLGKEDWPRDHTYDITGSLCENNDKFAVNRELPEISVGDIVAIHDTGAHGHAMGFNYNGKLRSAELLLKNDCSAQLIRRAETLNDLFATLDY